MPPLKTGDHVKIIDRDMTLADVKSGLYYDYFRNLTGTIERIYDDNTACINVDLDCLSEEVVNNHRQIEESIRNKWINGLGQEQRAKLKESDKKLSLRYNILVSVSDLAPAGKAKPAAKPATEKKPEAKTSSAAEKRPTQADIEKAEEEYLKSIAARAKE